MQNDKIEMNKFEDINHMPLRVFNRVVFANNLLVDFGKTTVEEYINLFSQEERKQMWLMQNYVQKFGLEKAKKFATNGLEIVDEEDEVSSDQ